MRLYLNWQLVCCIIMSLFHKVIPMNLIDEAGQCMFVKAEEGTYTYIQSPKNTANVCGLYVISEPDHVVEFEFDHFDISCSKGGLLSVIDGWELNGQFFPGTEDHVVPRQERYQEFCGSVKPTKAFRMSQNVGLLEFRIPTDGEGFTARVRFVENAKPCNAVLQYPQGVYTLRNFGHRINCTISIIFPESFRVLSASVGAQDKRVGSVAPRRNLLFESGIIKNCKKKEIGDYVEIRGGDGLDPHLMTVAEDFCGIDVIPSFCKHKVDVACGNTAVRLVSSGEHDNWVTIAFDLLLDIESPTLVCPAMVEALICKFASRMNEIF